MSLTSSLRNLRSTVASGRLVRNHRRSRTRGAVARFRPRFEALEARAMLSGTGWLLTTPLTGSSAFLDTPTDLAQDAAGNTYATGWFAGTMTIGPTTLVSDGAEYDFYVAKLDPAGGVLWAQRFGGAGRDFGNGVDVGNDGSVYVTGFFSGTLSLPTTSGPITLTSAGSDDAFVLKLDTGGNTLWARRSGTASAKDAGRAVAVAGDGSVYVSGHFNGDAVSSGTADFGTVVLTSVGTDRPTFLTKLNSAGDFLWARQLAGGQTNWDVMTEAGGDVFIVGGHVARYDSNGNLLWSQERVEENVGALYQEPITGKDYLYIAEVYGGIYGQRTLRKLDGDTGIEVWKKTGLPQTGNGNIIAIATDTSGHVYVTGPYEGLDDVDPGIGTFYLSTASSNQYLLKLDSTGVFVSARRMGYNNAMDVEVDAAGNVFLAGNWGGTADFDLGDATVVRTSPYGDSQGFFLKMTQGLGAISGRVFADADGNGTPGTDEPPLAGTTVYLDQNGNGIRDTDEASVTTDAFGVYNFKHLSAGTFTVRHVTPAGWSTSAPLGGAYSVTLAADKFVGGRDFGDHKAPVITTYTKNTSLAIRDMKTVTSTLVVSGGTSFIYDVDVRLNISHTNDGDLRAYLLAPDGTRNLLTNRRGGSGDNYTNTIFDDEAAVPISAGAAPFNGRYRPEWNGLFTLDGKNANGTWTLEVTDDTRRNTGTLLSWSLTVKGASTGSGLQAAQAADKPALASDVVATLTTEQLQPILAEAAARWSAAGADTSNLANVAVQIVDLADGYLGMADGNTIYLDDNAAGWGWFVDATPQNDLEFLRRGNQGESAAEDMDLLTVVMHELGHLLGHDHDQEGVMTKALAAGVRRTDTKHEHMALVDQVFSQPVDHHADGWLGAVLDEQLDSRRLWFKRRR